MQNKKNDSELSISAKSSPPVVVLAGRQNVGKSTLFNRLTKTRQALVADFPGLTRDRHYGRAFYYDDPYIVVDTGGFTTDKDDPFTAPVVKQLQMALLEADIIYFIVDARAGLHPLDVDLSRLLRKYPAKVQVVANKAEGLDSNIVSADFYKLGFGEPYTISASHGDFVKSLVSDTLLQFFPTQPIQELSDEEYFAEELDEKTKTIEVQEIVEENPKIRITVVGRPNAGKSTLINSLIGHQQLIVSPVSGTTRDSIEIDFSYPDPTGKNAQKNRELVLIDTAGVRKRGKIDNIAEKFSVIKTLEAIERAQVVIMVLDSSEGISTQEAHLAHYAGQAGKAMVVVFNKWDLLSNPERKKYKEEFSDRMSFLSFALPQAISAEKKQGLSEMMSGVFRAYDSANIKLSTKKLNDILQAAVQKQQPPFSGRFRPKMRYAHQGGRNPPLIIIHGNSVDKVADDYRRYLQNCFVSAFNLHGTPLIIKFKNSTNPYRKNER